MQRKAIFESEIWFRHYRNTAIKADGVYKKAMPWEKEMIGDYREYASLREEEDTQAKCPLVKVLKDAEKTYGGEVGLWFTRWRVLVQWKKK